MDPHLDPEAWRFAFNMAKLLGGLIVMMAAVAGGYAVWRLSSPAKKLEGLALLDEPRPLAVPVRPREMADA